MFVEHNNVIRLLGFLGHQVAKLPSPWRQESAGAMRMVKRYRPQLAK